MKKRKSESSSVEWIYVITLVLVLFMIMKAGTALKFPLVVMVFSLIGGAIIHFFLCILIGLKIDEYINRPFVNELNSIVKEYLETRDATKFYDELTNMRNQPKTVDGRNMLFLNVSTALSEQGKTEEALAVLDKIEPKSSNMEAIVNEQTKQILAGADWSRKLEAPEDNHS